ncbi:MAG: lysophospholipase [Acidimicrobiaceae bacterium]|nr:lysophospholipase [Acidimicrobiaceae bacterium]|tara:strand:- start:243 stop:1076 length:834 start_codon:yes stop_codon:yes gene_type:complete
MTDLEEFQVPGHAGALHVRLWTPNSTPRALIFILHGYAEHGGRYSHVAEALVAQGLAVLAPDHVGHGLSEGERALITDFGLVVDDLGATASATSEKLNVAVPLLLVGHSMGGLLAARFVQRWPNRAAGAAFLGAVIGDWKWARKVLSLPQLPPEDSDPMGMSRDLDVCRAYAADPLVYRGLYKRPLLEAEVVALDEFREEIHEIRIPVGFFHGTADPFVPYGDSLQAINDMPSAAKTIKLYAEAKHELVNEINKEEVIGDLQGWIDNTLSNQTEGTR